MDRLFKIVVIGNSVALRVRPPKQSEENLNYGSLLERDVFEEQMVLVENMGRSRWLMRDVLNNMEDYLQKFPDVFIINMGVVDASSREIPLWYANLIKRENKGIVSWMFSGIHANLIKRFSAGFVSLRGNKSWTSLRQFNTEYGALIDHLQKETAARIIAIPINPGNTRIENALPGSLKKYVQYNLIIEEITRKKGVEYLDLSSLNDADYPDGIHFSAQGHKKVANLITKVLCK